MQIIFVYENKYKDRSVYGDESVNITQSPREGRARILVAKIISYYIDHPYLSSIVHLLGILDKYRKSAKNEALSFFIFYSK